MARASIFVATVFASITSSTAVVGLDPVEISPTAQQSVPTVQTTTTIPVPSTPETLSPDAAATAPDRECREFSADFCVETSSQQPDAATTRLSSCVAPGEHSPTGTVEIVPTTTPPVAGALRIRIEIETGLAIDADCFATEVLEVLNDERGWSSVYGVGFTQVDNEEYDLRLVLASPATTDSLCYPARTVGIYSCRKGSRVVINLMRWETGSDDYSNDLTTYRQYLLNHEVGHFLGRGHEQCPGTGEPAPVMMQQTKGLDGCLHNGWPTESEQ